MTRLARIREIYKTTALLFFGTCVLFILLNAVLGIGFAIWDRVRPAAKGLPELQYDPVKGRYDVYNPTNGRFEPLRSVRKLFSDAALRRLYTGMTREQIDLMLTETWNRPFAYDPYLELREREFHGVFVNVDRNGFRKTINQGPWPPAPANLNIFLLGGSTAFGYGVPDDQTIASHLQVILAKRLGPNVKVYNFGRGYYYSTQERILFSQLLMEGFVPDGVVFVDGLNDFFQYDDEPVFTDQLTRYVDSSTELARLPVLDAFRRAAQRSREWEWLGRLPFFQLAAEIQMLRRPAEAAPADSGAEKKKGATLPLEPYIKEKAGAPAYYDPAILNHVIQRYERNKRLIEAAAQACGVIPLFVWQPVPTYRYDLMHDNLGVGGFTRHNYSTHGYPLMAQHVAAHPMGADFLWCADMQESLKEPLYVDRLHYSPKLSEMIAREISGPLATLLDTKARQKEMIAKR